MANTRPLGCSVGSTCIGGFDVFALTDDTSNVCEVRSLRVATAVISTNRRREGRRMAVELACQCVCSPSLCVVAGASSKSIGGRFTWRRRRDPQPDVHHGQQTNRANRSDRILQRGAFHSGERRRADQEDHDVRDAEAS